jgi:Ca2+-transporting ATPase
MDGPPALALGLEPIYGDLMKRPPIRRRENILSKPLVARIGLTGLYISAVFLLQYAFNFLNAADEQKRTVLFTMFALFQLFNAFNCRQLHTDSIARNFFKNRLMLVATLCTFIAQILIIQYAGAFFGTIPLPLTLWLKLFAVTFSVIVMSEIVKLIVKLRK